MSLQQEIFGFGEFQITLLTSMEKRDRKAAQHTNTRPKTFDEMRYTEVFVILVDRADEMWWCRNKKCVRSWFALTFPPLVCVNFICCVFLYKRCILNWLKHADDVIAISMCYAFSPAHTHTFLLLFSVLVCHIYFSFFFVLRLIFRTIRMKNAPRLNNEFGEQFSLSHMDYYSIC